MSNKIAERAARYKRYRTQLTQLRELLDIIRGMELIKTNPALSRVKFNLIDEIVEIEDELGIEHLGEIE